MGVTAVVLDIILPVFGVLGLGYLAARRGWFDAEANRGLSLYVFRVAIPLMLFRAMARAELPDAVPVGFILSYFGAAMAMFALGALVARRGFSFDLARQGLFGFGCSYSNLMLIGIPLVLTTWGEQAVLPLFTIVALHTPLMFTPLTAVLELSRGDAAGTWQSLRAALGGLARNQYIVGILAGLAWNLLDLPLSGSADAVLEMFARTATPCALFSMGIALSQYRVAGEVPAALTVSLLKGVVFPALVWAGGTWLFAVDLDWLAVAVGIAALPTGINIYLFAQQYQVGVGLSSTATVLSTALSVITLTLVLTLLGVR